jgi:hypothetical protein
VEEKPDSHYQGTVLLDLLADNRERWIARRTEHLQFQGEFTIERLTVCEVAIDSELAQALPEEQGLIPLPITDLVRAPARHIRVFDARSDLPVLTRSRERGNLRTVFVRDLLSNRAVRRTLRRSGAPRVTHHELLDGIIATALDPVLSPALSPRNDALRKVLFAEHPYVAALAAELYQLRTVYALVPKKELEETGRFLISESHVESMEFRRATLWLAIQSALMTNSPSKSKYAEWKHEPRHELLLSDGSAMRIRRYGGRQAESVYIKKWRWPWWPDAFIVMAPVDDFLEASSFHINVRTPVGTYIDSAIFRTFRFRGPTPEAIFVEDDDYNPDRAHLHFTPSIGSEYHPADSSADDYYPGQLKLVVRPTYHSGLRAGLHISLVATAALWALALSTGWSTAGYDCRLMCGVALAERPDINSIVSVLLLAPSLAIAVVLRQDEADFAKRVQSRYRMRLYLTGLSLFASSLGLALIDGGALFVTLLAGAVLSSCCFLSTAASALYSRWSVRKKSLRAAHATHAGDYFST